MNSAATRATYHHGDLSRALLDASLALVAEHGVEAFSLRAAARAAGVNPAAAYRHYSDRAQLLGAVAASGFRMLSERMQEASAAQDAAASFDAVGGAYIRFALEHADSFRVMFGPYGSRAGSAARQILDDDGTPSTYGILLKVVTDLAPGMRESEANSAALSVWAAVHGLATLLVDRAIELDAEGTDAAIAAVLRSARRGVEDLR